LSRGPIRLPVRQHFSSKITGLVTFFDSSPKPQIRRSPLFSR
jgi:hypothetical protein